MLKSRHPTVKNNLLLLAATNPNAVTSVPVGSSPWFEWLANHQAFLFEDGAGHFTARRELRRGREYWYAYRRRAGKLFKTYLGKSDELSAERLEQASMYLAGHTLLPPNALDRLARLYDLESATNFRSELSIRARTKTRLPALPCTLIARGRLTQQITTPITIVHAPSGYGKTTLLNEWRQACGRPVAWAWLDSNDNHPMHFWSTLVTALQTLQADLGRALLPQIQTPTAMAGSEAALNLAHEITRVASNFDTPGHLVLILDDYHHITQPAIHAAVDTFLEHLPPTLQLILSSRTVPPLNLNQQRTASTVTTLATDDLRLTFEEGIDFLERYTLNRPLAYSEMEILVKRTEGWIAGLKLAALALDQQDDRRQFTATFTGTHTYLRTYFTDNVLQQLPMSTQVFLFKTAILRQLTGDVCNAVTGQTDGAEILAEIWQKGMFLLRLEEPGWYRYHELFAEMLNGQLQLQFPAEIPNLHRRAAEWYRTHESPADALYHLFLIQAYEEAADLIEDIAVRELKEFGEESRVLHWLRQLPIASVQQRSLLLHVYLRVGALALPDAHLNQYMAPIERSIGSVTPHERTPNEQVVLQKIQHLRQRVDKHPALISLEERVNDWQILDEILRLQYPIRQDPPQAEALAREIYETGQTRHNLYVMLIAGGMCAGQAYLQGHFRRSENMANQVLRQAMTQCRRLPDMASISLMTLSRICYARNQLTQAHQLLLRVAEVAPNPVSSNILIMSAITRAKIQAAQGRGEAAVATLQAARELQANRPSRIWPNEDLLSYQALFHLRNGDINNAENLISQAGDTDAHPLTALVKAELLLQQGQTAATVDLLTRLLRHYPHGLPHEPLLNARVMLAVALFKEHKLNEAQHVMIDAIRLAAPELFIRPFLDCGSQSLTLLTWIMENGALTLKAQTFVKEILRMTGQVDGAPEPSSKSEFLALTMAASISRREQEVLRLLGAGLSNREIAIKLFISDSTVKTHLENIYLKLNAHSRTQAIAQAQALQLV